MNEFVAGIVGKSVVPFRRRSAAVVWVIYPNAVVYALLAEYTEDPRPSLLEKGVCLRQTASSA